MIRSLGRDGPQYQPQPINGLQRLLDGTVAANRRFLM